MVTRLFQNFAVDRDAARRAGLSATAELLVGNNIAAFGNNVERNLVL